MDKIIMGNQDSVLQNNMHTAPINDSLDRFRAPCLVIV